MITVNINIPDLNPFVLTQTDYIQGFDLLYECDSDITKIYSAISANELNLTLINRDSVFSLENTESPLFDKIGEGTELEVFETLSGEPISRGKFYIVDYKAPLTAMTSTFSVRAVDRLQAILNKDVSLEHIRKGLSVYDYFLQIFLNLGIGEDVLIIDDSLKSVNLDFSIFNGKKMAEILNSLCLASDCMVFVDLKGRIQVKGKNVVGSAVKHFTTNNITSLETSKSLSFDYNLLKLGYISASISDNMELLKTTISCPSGVYKIENIEMSKDNVYEIDNIKVSSSPIVQILGCSYSQSLLSLELNNTTEEELNIEVVVTGKVIETTTAYITTKNDTDIHSNGEKTLELVSESIQNKVYAETLSLTYWERLNQKIPYVNLTTRSNSLQFTPCMIVDVIEPIKAKLNYLGYIHTLQYEWNGADSYKVEIGIKAAKGVESDE